MAVVSGRLQIRDWTDRDGGKRRSAEVVVDNIYFGESKRRDSGDSRSDSYSNSYSRPQLRIRRAEKREFRSLRIFRA